MKRKGKGKGKGKGTRTRRGVVDGVIGSVDVLCSFEIDEEI